MVEFIEGDPPRHFSWYDVVDELKQRPNVWAVIRQYDSESSVSSAASHARRYHKLDAAVRKLDGQGWVLYCKYPEP